MRSLTWSTSHAVFVQEIDDEHKAIFEAVSNLQKLLASHGSVSELRTLTERLISCIVEHFAHEERLMRAARYGSTTWHKRKHAAARTRVGQFAGQIEHGDTGAGLELVEYLTSWLHEHTRVADRMLGAFLRNHERSMFKLTFRAGTRPMDACPWVDTHGDTFDPRSGENRS